ncbi:hypothetical protein [Flavobacterium sp.]|jgi:hypothetical protein|uniref:hypothetical protein n=1 Tax=Flavobacterium sp. TaxID=239 RepID=UPI0037C07596
MDKKKVSAVQLIVFGVTFAIAYFVTQYFLFKNEDTPNTMLVENARIANKNLPKMLDKETRLDSISVDNTTLKYHHTLINTDKDSTEFDFALIQSEMSQKAQENLNTNPVMKDYRENNISLHYIFKDKNNNNVFDYTVKPKVKK